jgi:hypothetical protein
MVIFSNESKALSISVAIVVGLLVFGIVVMTSAGSGSQSVKFAYISAPSQMLIDQGDTFAVRFILVNNAPSSVSDVVVKATYDGQQEFFSVDKPTVIIENPIAASGGRSAEQTVSITGVKNSQLAVEANFTFSVYVDSNVTDTKVFKVRLDR